MRSRTLGALALLLALSCLVVSTGCSQSAPPPPTVDNTGVEATKSVDATLGVDTVISVKKLTTALKAQGLDVAEVPTDRSGLFIPAKYVPMTADGAFLQLYKFESAGEAKGAAGTVDAGGFVMGATPDTLVNVNWTGWPAFFRSGDLIVIFVTEKGKKNAARDLRVYKALNKAMGAPFMGGNTPPPSAHTGGTPAASATLAATSTGS